MTEIEMGKISSRGQVAIPSDIRDHMGLTKGSKILFFLEDNVLIMKKVEKSTFAELTKPLREAKKKITEDEVDKLIHKIRRK
jgi:AbrB family looped-hinge helix DNA binding protein